jgi:hypothetical protein
MHDSWISGRTHRALLRSTNHVKRDGAWSSDDSGSFHVYIEDEPACLSEAFPFTYPSFEAKGQGDYPGDPVDDRFRVCITRNWDSSVYYGPLASVEPPVITDPDFGDFVLALNAQGTSFIKRARPGNPTANLFQFTGELRNIPVLPRLRYLGLKSFKDLGSNYLNVEFGWKPFTKDLLDMYRTQKMLEATLKKLRENNGLIIRRRDKKRTSLVTTSVCEGSLMFPFGDLGDTSIGGNSQLSGYRVGCPTGVEDVVLNSFSGQCDYHYQVTDELTTWNCGNFGYYVPDIGSDEWTERAKKALFGTNPSPNQLWELLPWSWLIDWFSNVGDIMSNLSSNAVDNETWTNCFAMRTVTRTHQVTISTHWDHLIGSAGFDVPAGQTNLVYTRTETNKLRRQASPYGFGLDWPDFSVRQVLILAALGITRVL